MTVNYTFCTLHSAAHPEFCGCRSLQLFLQFVANPVFCSLRCISKLILPFSSSYCILQFPCFYILHEASGALHLAAPFAFCKSFFECEVQKLSHPMNSAAGLCRCVCIVQKVNCKMQDEILDSAGCKCKFQFFFCVIYFDEVHRNLLWKGINKGHNGKGHNDMVLLTCQ